MLKRAFDITLGGLALALASPLFLLVALAIKLESRGPVFYKHLRVGRSGRSFLMYKFRSMVQEADKVGGSLTVGGDPRITRVGGILRKTKIDELPNFINVLRGEMSVVGPRAEHPKYVAMYTDEQRRVLTVRPGVTDPGVAGPYRNEQEILAGVPDPESHYVHVIMQHYLKVNLEYVDAGFSIWRDLGITARTVRAVLMGR